MCLNPLQFPELVLAENIPPRYVSSFSPQLIGKSNTYRFWNLEFGSLSSVDLYQSFKSFKLFLESALMTSAESSIIELLKFPEQFSSAEPVSVCASAPNEKKKTQKKKSFHQILRWLEKKMFPC
jgi:hypothetical protein